MLRPKPCMHSLRHPQRKLCSSLLQTRLTSSIANLALLRPTDAGKLHQVHAHMIVTGVVKDHFAASQLLASPALPHSDHGHLIFAHISHPNLFIWNTMIRKLGERINGHSNPPLSLYKQMLLIGLRPNAHTFLFLIKAPKFRLNLREGKEIHCNVLKIGFGLNQFVISALIGLYSNCGRLDDSRQVFDEIPQPSLVLWTTMIRAYVSGSHPKEGLKLFEEMKMRDIVPDSIAMAIVISACNQLGDIQIGKMIHGYLEKSGIDMDTFIRSGLLNMYAGCGSLELSRQVFDEMPQRNIVIWNAMIHQYAIYDHLAVACELFEIMPEKDVISWNTMIAGFSQAGQCMEALALFHEMELACVKPNKVTMLSVLSSCASIGTLDMGMWVHTFIERNSMDWDGFLDPALIDMYSKCGSIDRALQVFEKTPKRDLFSWTSIICGLAMHGHGKRALDHFSLMLEMGIAPDGVTLLGVLNACAHAGLLDQGCRIFYSMEKDYHIIPTIEHYGCMVDLLGRLGRLHEAYKLITEMAMKPNASVWGALLSACKVHHDVELGEIVAKRLTDLAPYDPGIQILMSNIYAEACKWDGVMRLRKEVKEMGMRKTPGCSWIEVNGMVNQFLVRDNSHPLLKEIHCILENIEKQSLV